ncbi:MAG: type II toxin-antitoxin system RelE/ParE family toxin [Bradyrhizobium sp.]|nr:type II toxin-antitoxin system RelE/ParE family toxin [Bradyrhizobium sp.]
MASFLLWKIGRQWRILPRWHADSLLLQRRLSSAARLCKSGTRPSEKPRNPEEGDLIPETGGVRKIRWARPGSGKRGGARVIYFYHSGDRPLYLLLVYAKARQENLTVEEKKIVRKLAAILKS